MKSVRAEMGLEAVVASQEGQARRATESARTATYRKSAIDQLPQEVGF